MTRTLGAALAVLAVTAPAAAKPAAKHHHHHATHHAHAHAKHTAPAAAAPDTDPDADTHEPADENHATRFTSPSDAKSMPAYHYGQLSSADCKAELATRKIPFASETAAGVATPVRLKGPLHGVTFHAEVEEKQRATTPYEIADCSLVLALDDFAELLSAHDVVEVVHYSMYRPPPDAWPADQIGKRHNGAVAIDAARFVKSDGTSLSVLDDFHGKIGAKTCTDGAAPDPVSVKATELRAILCETVARHIFNVALTPNYNYPHRNHFHLEVTHGVTWFLVH